MKRSILLLAIILSLNIAAQTPARMEAIQFIQEGDIHVRNGDWESALFSYTNAIMADIDYAEAYMKRGQLYERTLHFQEALMDYNQAILLNPFIEVYYDERSRFKMLSLDYKGALNDLDIAITLEPKNTTLKEHKVDQYLLLGFYQEAFADLASFDSSEKGSEFYFQRLSYLHLLNNEIESCKTAALKALEVNPTSYISYDILGMAYLREENYETAKTYFDTSISIDSNQFISFYNRSICNRIMGNEAESLADINKAIELNEDKAELMFKRALIKKESGDLDGAADDYENAILLDSSYFDAVYNLVFTNILLGEYYNAENNLNMGFENEFQNTEYWNLKGVVAILNNQFDLAITYFNRSVGINNQNPKTYYNRGMAFLMSNRPLQACEDFEKSYKLGFERALEVSEFFCGH